jgi:ribose transport system permease protein
MNTKNTTLARLRSLLERHVWIWAAVASIVLWLVGSAIGGSLSTRLLFVNATLAIFLALAGIAQMIMITSGDGSFDLSLPYTITISAIISAGVLGQTGPGQLWAILEAIGAGLVIGLANGLLTSLFEMPALIASLASGYVVYSLILVLQVQAATGANGVSPGLGTFLHHQADGASIVLALGVVVAIIFGAILTRTVYGRYLHAMGQSRPAARLAGINIPRMIIVNFMISGFLGAGVGILLAAYDGGAFQNLGSPYLLGSVAAVVVGGNRVSGGKSSVAATMFGALVMTLLLTVLELSRLSAGYQDIIDGAAVISIVCAAQIGRTRAGA